MSDGGRVRELVIGAGDFQVVRRLPFELANVPREVIVALGWWSPENGEYLRRLARSIPSQVAAATRVRIVITDVEIEDLSRSGRPASEDEIVRFVPESVAQVWPELMRGVFDALGALETRYRTGFHEAEVSQALRALDGIGEL
ncbi:hypothetical protein IU433_20755 [Nocardia puris]|uniref:hypothetical protein n=1 Tax=Nocardia puris TaxID=208602 RepID=UPI001895E7E7|nr:hypothetical protein [Nocardia puris]MBF6209439.1 hypothetical protein [Nocardia puris]MBF6367805.1 hypothetical protein [Nocardia puris]MBF6461457.1 hypothetical protein [Nocardia puris]